MCKETRLSTMYYYQIYKLQAKWNKDDITEKTSMDLRLPRLIMDLITSSVYVQNKILHVF